MAPVNSGRKTTGRKGRTAARRPRSSGEITSKVSDELAKEAERGYDLSKAKRRRTGRPSLGSRGESPRVTFRAAPELYEAARARAEREGRTMSELARDALATYIGE